MKNTLNKTIVIYCLTALLAFIFDKIYSLFSHGISSEAMSNMYIWLILCGVLVFILIKLFFQETANLKGFRLFYNLYNSGVAILISGMLLQGILDIAGGSSEYNKYYYYLSYCFIGISVILFIRILIKNMKK